LATRSSGDHSPASRSGSNHVRLGFVPLIDAAPLVVAAELGLFDRHGVRVTLERQIGWANVRDKLAFGHLDASHALLGLPLASVVHPESQGEPLVSVLALSSGGNAITLSRRLTEAGVNSAATLARWIHDPQADRQPVFGHVFGCSMHHYLLRDWLDHAGVHPDLDVRLCVIPPSQMTRQLAAGQLDGFCVGEPWNSLAAHEGWGDVICPTSDILPAHPEKVLAATRRWAHDNAAALVPLIRAILRACAYCNDANHLAALSDLLAEPKYVGVDAAVIRTSLSLDRTFGLNPRFTSVRPIDWQMRSFARDATFPSRTHVAWLLEQMVRWGHAPSDLDPVETAGRCTDSTAYRRAAESLGIACPPTEYPPMPLRGGLAFEVGSRTDPVPIAPHGG
jgi:ABC-type nitrate/sulfonate/bicarbonate transport system substrate-binding protein